MNKGRDSVALCSHPIETMLFVLDTPELCTIEERFPDIYEEMKKLGLKRYKNHRILIGKSVKAYTDMMNE